MSSEVLISVPAEVAAQIFAQASDTGRTVGDTLRNLMDAVQQQSSPVMSEWPDENVTAAADLKLPARDQERISDLLYKQQAGRTSLEDQAELRNLMTCYQALQLYQARALAEAIRHGLRPVPLISS